MDYAPYYDVLRTTTLFAGISQPDIAALLTQFSPALYRCRRGEWLLMAGDETDRLGIVLSGSVSAVKSTPEGETTAITHMEAGGIFGDILSAGAEKSPVSVQAGPDTSVLFLSRAKLLFPGSAHPAHWQLLQNWVGTISAKYFALDKRLDLLTCKSLRTRICRWLLAQSEIAGADTFTVPMTRAELAVYLNCDRSALSRELGRMQREGLLETWHGSFKLSDKARLR